MRDSFQTNVTTGVILSVPSLLFPSLSGPVASAQLTKEATIALASRLAQVPHQEAVLKSLIKIRDAVGVDAFEGYLEDYDNKLKRNIEILSKIYNVRSSGKTRKKIADGKGIEKTEKELDRKWEESDSDTSGIVEEEDEVNSGAMPAARVVLETEIKFNEETAITMTILEEKEDSEKEQDDESGTDVRNDAENKDSSPDRRKTPRRVHFGGEIVKLRTPDSDETESIEAAPKTRIPVPVSPATKMPKTRRRPSSQPCSPQRDSGKMGRPARSVSSSPKREVYTHNAQLSPKKSILTRTSSPVVARFVESKKKKDAVNAESVEDEKSSTKGLADNENLQDKRREEMNWVQGPQSLGPLAVSNWMNPDEKQREPLVVEGSKNSLKTGRDSEDSTRHKKDAKEEKNYWERKHQDSKAVESDQKNIIEDKAALLENVSKVDHLFGSPVENEVECDRDDDATAKDSGVHEEETTDDARLKKSNVEHGERSARSDKTVTSMAEKRGKVVQGADGMEVILEEPSWEDLGLVDREVLEDLHNKVSDRTYST